ncbi:MULTISPECIES: GNAT family N-acetyltransferase [Rhizobium/Agrobacterium group]|uniref:GNAT family N-acetyltransferase n=2 Tax=Neorhizobium TaxID=1525371 RepID=A0ABV0M1H8_9HYPH|nr:MULTISPECIES: GNAT family N-acetyltransferase [Rhizobium/Agrobacterium group]KGE00619.1 GCN5 family acetyltransferase [Rhizobium sp. YS-1r]MCC2610216.1 GNAT family N-acetyltransferase [Neorhizobium petrolearium]WGI70375.1 GNAT family N-acetyltransferase [Neorhizobium petrolearium]
MKTENPPLPSGYSAVPPGKLANVETRLEMFARPPAKAAPETDASLVLKRWLSPEIEAYRALFRAVGEDWMWVSRLVMADDKLAAILRDPQVEVFRLMDGDRAIGLLELDFREESECELTFFGLVADAIGKGAGRFLMDRAIEIAWSRPIRRFWVHTCTFDHPSAVKFYQRSGFRPYAFMVEVIDDPRLVGLMPKNAAAHVPLIEF